MIGKLGKLVGSIAEGSKIRATQAAKSAAKSLFDALLVEVLKRAKTWIEDVLARRQPQENDPTDLN